VGKNALYLFKSNQNTISASPLCSVILKYVMTANHCLELVHFKELVALVYKTLWMDQKIFRACHFFFLLQCLNFLCLIKN